MATMEADIKHILTSLDNNSIEHKAIIEALNDFKLSVETELKNKADKTFVQRLSNKIWAFTIGLVGMLLGVVAYLLRHILTN
jgi:ribonuclease HI